MTNEEIEKISKQIEKLVEKTAKSAKKEIAGDNKSENYKTLDGLMRSVAKKADAGEPAVDSKKLKSMCLNLYESLGNDTATRADVEKVIKSLSSHILSMPKPAKEPKAEKVKVKA